MSIYAKINPYSVKAIPDGALNDNVMLAVAGEAITVGKVLQLKSDGKVYIADITNLEGKVIGIALKNASTDSTLYVKISGVLRGVITGLTQGEFYYLDTSGNITANPSGSRVLVGKALSDDELLLMHSYANDIVANRTGSSYAQVKEDGNIDFVVNGERKLLLDTSYIDVNALPQNLLRGYDRFAIWSKGTPVGYEDANTGFANLITNGEFETFTGTPDDGVSDTFDGWEGVNVDDSIGSTVEATTNVVYSGSYSLKVTRGSTATYSVWLKQIVDVEPEKLYRLQFYSRGDAGGENLAYDITPATSSDSLIGGAKSCSNSTAFSLNTKYFYVPSEYTQIAIWLGVRGAEQTGYFDSVSFSQITVACTGANGDAPEGMGKPSYLKLYRIEDGLPDGCKFGVKGINTDDVNNQSFYFRVTGVPIIERQFLIGRRVVFGCWMKANSNQAFIHWWDNVNGSVIRSYHSGSGNWEWLEFSLDVPTNDWTSCTIEFVVPPNETIEVCQPMLAYGSRLGEGNYVAGSGWIPLEERVYSEYLPANTVLSDISKVLKLYEDSEGLIAEAQEIACTVSVKDSASDTSGVSVFFGLNDISPNTIQNRIILSGIPDNVNVNNRLQVPIRNGEFQAETDTSGVNTLTVVQFFYGMVRL